MRTAICVLIAHGQWADLTESVLEFGRNWMCANPTHRTKLCEAMTFASARAQRNQNQFKCVYCWFRLRFKAMKKRNSRKCHCLDDGAAEIVLESRHWNTNNHYYVYKVRYYLFFHATHSTLLPRPSIESSHGHRTLILRIYNIFFFFIHTTHVPPTMQRNKETAEETKRNERKKKPIRIYWIK